MVAHQPVDFKLATYASGTGHQTGAPLKNYILRRRTKLTLLSKRLDMAKPMFQSYTSCATWPHVDAPTKPLLCKDVSPRPPCVTSLHLSLYYKHWTVYLGSENHRRYKRVLAHGRRIMTKVISRRHKVLLLDGRQRFTNWVAEYYQARVQISLELTCTSDRFLPPRKHSRTFINDSRRISSDR